MTMTKTNDSTSTKPRHVYTFNKATERNATVIVHVLRFHQGNPNRGENGMPKYTAQGGDRRMHLSTQCHNATTKWVMQEDHLLDPNLHGICTSQLKEHFIEAAKDVFPDDNERKAIAASVVIAIRGKEDAEKSQPIPYSNEEFLDMAMQIHCLPAEKLDILRNPMANTLGLVEEALRATKTLPAEDVDAFCEKLEAVVSYFDKHKVYFGVTNDPVSWEEQEVKTAVTNLEEYFHDEDEEVQQRYTGLRKHKSKGGPTGSVKKIRDVLKSINVGLVPSLEVILRGRFSTDKTEHIFHQTTGCLTVLGAVGVHSHCPVQDYLTCMDDRENGGGAAHISRSRWMHRTLAYEYVALNVRDLMGHLNLRPEKNKLDLRNQIIAALIHALWHFQPKGGRKMGGNKYTPELMLVEVRPDNHATNLCSAFIDPVPANGEMLATASDKLCRRLVRTNRGYEKKVTLLAAGDGDPACTINFLPEGVTESLWTELADKIIAALDKARSEAA
jgi:hypothetical protein